jgi:hypothetical protein
MNNKQRTTNWVATLPTLTSEEDVLALRAIKSAVKAINESNAHHDHLAYGKGWRQYKRFDADCNERRMPRYRVTIRARGPVDGYKYGYGGYLKLAGGSRFDVYIHERRA